jgi:hypothetical protein
LRAGHKGATDPGPVTSTELDANRQALDVCIKVTGEDTEECFSPSGGGGGGDASAANQTTIIGHVDGVEGLLTTIDADTGNIATNTSATSSGVGATGDAAATAGSTGSLSAKLRLITSQLDAIQTAVQTLDNAISGSEMQVDGVGALPAGNNNIGDVDVASIAAGDNNIGNVDVASIAAGDNNIGNVDVVTLPALPAGNNNIGDVDVATLPGTGTEDAAETAGGTLVMSGTVRRDTAASSAGTSGDNATLNTDANGLAWTRTMDPCSALAKTYIPVNISTATTTELTSSLAGASTHYYICSLNLITAAANNVALVDDDTDNCPSVTSGLAGGTTADSGWNFAANGGLTFGNGQGSVFRTNGTNRVLCLVTSAATRLSGSLSVVAAP